LPLQQQLGAPQQQLGEACSCMAGIWCWRGSRGQQQLLHQVGARKQGGNLVNLHVALLVIPAGLQGVS
jgi:hypothetical protein